jgi:prevent-host-death family protein
MDKYISATEANQRFSELLRDVSEGESYTVTSRGKPVARMVPAGKKQTKAGLEEYYAKCDARGPIVTGPWKREDLYDRSDRNIP